MKSLYEVALQVNAGSQVDAGSQVAYVAVDRAVRVVVDDAIRWAVNVAVPSGTAAHMNVSEVVYRAVNGFNK